MQWKSCGILPFLECREEGGEGQERAKKGEKGREAAKIREKL